MRERALGRMCGCCLLGSVGAAALVGGGRGFRDVAARRRLPERAYVRTDTCACACARGCSSTHTGRCKCTCTCSCARTSASMHASGVRRGCLSSVDVCLAHLQPLYTCITRSACACAVHMHVKVYVCVYVCVYVRIVYLSVMHVRQQGTPRDMYMFMHMRM